MVDVNQFTNQNREGPKLVYRDWQQIVSGDRFQKLAQRGARNGFERDSGSSWCDDWRNSSSGDWRWNSSRGIGLTRSSGTHKRGQQIGHERLSEFCKKAYCS